jgi:hypothetical protein
MHRWLDGLIADATDALRRLGGDLPPLDDNDNDNDNAAAAATDDKPADTRAVADIARNTAKKHDVTARRTYPFDESAPWQRPV